MRSCLLIVLAVLAVACGGKNKDEATNPSGATTTGTPTGKSGSGPQSFGAAMRIMCDAPTQCCDDAEAAQKATMLANWIVDRVSNEEAKALFASLAEEGKDKPTVVKEGLKRSSIEESDCAFLTVVTPSSP